MKDKIYKISTRQWNSHLKCEVLTYKYIADTEFIREEIVMSCPKDPLLEDLEYYGR